MKEIINDFYLEKNIVNENIESFFEYLDVNEITINLYKKGIRNFLEFLNKFGIKHPLRVDFKNYREYLKESMSVNTINTYLTCVRAFFKYLEANGIYQNITKDVKNVKTSTIPKHQVLSEEKSREIYRGLTDKRDKLLFGLAITTGLRASEIANAKIENIKEYNGEVVLFVKCKKRDDESEYSKLSNEVLKDLFDYIQDRRSGYIFVSNSKRNKDCGVTSKTIRLLVKNILKKFGIEEDGFSCHSLRRSSATISYNNGADIVAIQQFLHQRSIATTRRYIQQCSRDNNKSEYELSKSILGDV